MLKKILSRYSLASLLFISLVGVSNSQEFYDKHLRLEEWYEGEIVLKSGDTIKADINFNYFLNLVQYLDDEKIQALGVIDVSSFKLYATDSMVEQNFKSLDLPFGHTFYRVLGEDSEKAFLIQTFVQTYKTYYAQPTIAIGGSKVDKNRTASVRSAFERTEVYILAKSTGEIEPFAQIALNKRLKGRVHYKTRVGIGALLPEPQTKKELEELLLEFEPNIRQYIQENSLNIRKRSDLIKIILYVMNKK